MPATLLAPLADKLGSGYLRADSALFSKASACVSSIDPSIGCKFVNAFQHMTNTAYNFEQHCVIVEVDSVSYRNFCL